MCSKSLRFNIPSQQEFIDCRERYCPYGLSAELLSEVLFDPPTIIIERLLDNLDEKVWTTLIESCAKFVLTTKEKSESVAWFLVVSSSYWSSHKTPSCLYWFVPKHRQIELTEDQPRQLWNTDPHRRYYWQMMFNLFREGSGSKLLIFPDERYKE